MIICHLSYMCHVKEDCDHSEPHELENCADLRTPSGCPYTDSVCLEQEIAQS
jgi:hypothetical protein